MTLQPIHNFDGIDPTSADGILLLNQIAEIAYWTSGHQEAITERLGMPYPERRRPQTPYRIYAGKITNNNGGGVNTTYDAEAFAGANISVTGQAPLTRIFSTDDLEYNAAPKWTDGGDASVNKLAICTLVQVPDGNVYLWECQETLDLSSCDDATPRSQTEDSQRSTSTASVVSGSLRLGVSEALMLGGGSL